MGIKTSTFGGVTLTGNAAKVFEKQFLSRKTKSNPKAQKSLDAGRNLLKNSNRLKGDLKIKAN